MGLSAWQNNEHLAYKLQVPPTRHSRVRNIDDRGWWAKVEQIYLDSPRDQRLRRVRGHSCAGMIAPRPPLKELVSYLPGNDGTQNRRESIEWALTSG
jgi:hypothetical protein